MEELSVFKKEIESLLEKFFEGIKNVEPRMLEFVKDYTLRGGKRIRAAFLYFTYKAYCPEDLDKAENAAMAMELLQSSLLIHDDIIDEDTTRRGKPTIHKMYEEVYNDKKISESMAILAGDLCYTLSYQVLNSSGFSSEKVCNITKIMSEVIHDVIYGQTYDVSSEYEKVNRDVIDRINYYKTARYSAEGPIKIGLALAGQADNSLLDYGKSIGIAFQIQDDLLGIMGSDKLGKDLCSDIREGKINNVTFLLSEKCSKEEWSFVKSLKGRILDESEILEIQQLVRKYKVDLELRERIDELMGDALELIPKDLSDEGKLFFRGMIDFLRMRDN